MDAACGWRAWVADWRLRDARLDGPERFILASFSKLTLLETLPEARRDPALVPNGEVAEMADMYLKGAENPRHRYRVAVDDQDAPIGHAIALLRTDKDEVPFGYSYSRYVLPVWRRRGIARALLLDALQWWAAHDAAYVQAHTHPTNTPLLSLFQSEGFAVMEHTTGRWESLLLRRDLL